jgi:hypothetical protein
LRAGLEGAALAQAACGQFPAQPAGGVARILLPDLNYPFPRCARTCGKVSILPDGTVSPVCICGWNIKRPFRNLERPADAAAPAADGRRLFRLRLLLQPEFTWRQTGALTGEKSLQEGIGAAADLS